MPDELASYLRNRVRSSGYRGVHLSQHNRLDVAKVKAVCSALASTRLDSIPIPPGDDPLPTRGAPHPDLRSKLPAYATYIDLVEAIRDLGVEVTFNSLKKNLLPDLDNMGFVKRETSATGTTVVTLLPQGAKLVDAGDREARVILGTAVESYIRTRAPRLLKAIDEAISALDFLTLDDLMLVISDAELPSEEMNALVRELRSRKGLEKAELLNDVRTQCEMTMTRPKVDKRDFNNWRNQAAQIITLCGFIPGFSLIKGDEPILTSQVSEGAAGFEATRSDKVRRDAREWHSVSSADNLEMHHILPISYAQSTGDLGLIDDRRNLIPLTPNAHKRIPTTGNTLIMVDWDLSTSVLTLRHPTRVDEAESFLVGQEARPATRNRNEVLAYNELLVAHFS